MNHIVTQLVNIGDTVEVKSLGPLDGKIGVVKAFAPMAGYFSVEFLDQTCDVHISDLFKMQEQGCSHTFVNYMGLNESFRFCSKCDLISNNLE